MDEYKFKDGNNKHLHKLFHMSGINVNMLYKLTHLTLTIHKEYVITPHLNRQETKVQRN
jgi:hypothetical protein